MKNYLLSILLLTYFSIKAQCVSDISSGRNHSIFLRDDGTLWGFGYGLDGSYALGSFGNILEPTQIGNDTDWSNIYAGRDYTIVKKNNGSLWGQGNNTNGAVGAGPSGFAQVTESFTQIGNDNDWSKVAPSSSHCLALKTDGTLWGWGSNQSKVILYSESADTIFDTPVQIGTDTDWVEIEAGLHTSLAIKEDGTIWTWGSSVLHSSTYEMEVEPLVSGFSKLSRFTSGVHTLVLKDDGSLYVFGTTWNNANACLGLGPDAISALYFFQIGTSTDWQYISAGNMASYGIKENGTLWAWGVNEYGQVGDGTTEDKFYPTQIGTDTDWVMVKGGWRHAIALKSNGDLYSWGSGQKYQLGNNASIQINILQPTLIDTCVTMSTVDLNLQKANNIAYPNPFSEEINLYIGNGNTGTPISVSIIDLEGKLILQDKYVLNTHKKVHISTQNLSKGIYFIKVTNKNQSLLTLYKIVKN